MKPVSNNTFFPNINQISLLSSGFLLSYILLGMIILPSDGSSSQIPRSLTQASVDPRFYIGLSIAGLTAAGTNWLIRSHPLFQERFTVQHWLLPSLTAWILGLFLFQQPLNLIWWIILFCGVFVLILIIISEYVIVDPKGEYRYIAVISLTALSYALFLTLAIILRGINARMLVLLPTIAIAGVLTSLRTLHLQLKKWYISYSLVISVIVGEFSVPINYLEFEPIVFGLTLLGAAYGLTSLSSGLIRGRSFIQSLGEPLIVVIVVWCAAIFI